MFRFEYFENVVSKHHLNNISFGQAAHVSALNMYKKTGMFGGNAMSVCNVRMVDDDTFEIIKRSN